MMVEVDVGDKKQVKKRKKKASLVRDNQLEEIRQILNTAFGRKFLWRVLSRCHMTHTISQHDSHSMALLSGERDIGLWLLDEINKADKNGYIKLINESNKDV